MGVGFIYGLLLQVYQSLNRNNLISNVPRSFFGGMAWRDTEPNNNKNMKIDELPVWGEAVPGIAPPDETCTEYLNCSQEDITNQHPDAEISKEGDETYLQFRQNNQTISLVFKDGSCTEAFCFSDSNLPQENIPRTFNQPNNTIKETLKRTKKRL